MSNQTDDIKDSISRYLSMREHSRKELIDKLSKKDFDMDSILKCVDEFSMKDLQSDDRYTESYVDLNTMTTKDQILFLPLSGLRE